LTLTGNTTQNVGQFVANGSLGNIITINAATLATVVPILNKTGGGTIQCNYLNLQGVNVTPANTWYYGNQSLNSSTNSVGYGLNFGGQASSGDYVSAANSATANQIHDATAYSIEAWVIARSVGSTAGRIVDKGDGTTLTKGYALWTSSNLVNFRGYDTAARTTTANTRPITYNQLAHIICTWVDGQAPKIYVDGTECGYSASASITTPNDDSAQALAIGNGTYQTRTFDGTIYAVRIYRNVALTSGNVTTLYNAGCKAVNPLGNATSEYLFNEGTGTNLDDNIGGADGTITGADWANLTWKAGIMPSFLPFF